MPQALATKPQAASGTFRKPAERLAELARRARRQLHEAIAAGRLKDLCRRFESAHQAAARGNGSPGSIADDAAQVLTLGLFTAASHHAGPEPFDLPAARAALQTAGPLGKQLSRSLLGDGPSKIVYRELATDIVGILREACRQAPPATRCKKQQPRDPLTHLYEDFLGYYNPDLRIACGVYYTPGPLVSCIVRGAHHLLKTRLGLRDGLADPNVLIVDPACGTGAFLCGAVELIREIHAKRHGAEKWPEYAYELLAKRLIGLEKLPAPQAVAHMMLRRHLVGPANGRMSNCNLNIIAADALGETGLEWERDWVTSAASKTTTSVTVVLGNPPYSGISGNKAPWIDDLLHGKLPDGGNGASYYHVDGKPLREKKVWLQDDYVKFTRLGQWLIERSRAGILAFVTNHAYLDNPTFRGMRQSLMQTFSDIHILDLHGNNKKKETAPDGSADQNVFDIQQGVAVGMFVKKPGHEGSARIRHGELWGSREEKLRRLSRARTGITCQDSISPSPPHYLFVLRDEKLRREYERGWRITDIMPANTTGIVTARDRFVYDLDEQALLKRMADLRDSGNSNAALRAKYFAGRGSPKYPPGDTRSWKLPLARRRLREDKHWRRRIVPCLYRPFDVRPLYYVPWMVDWPRPEVMGHLQAGENLALVTVRQVAEGHFNHAFVTETIADGRVTLSNKGIAYVFPLYLYDIHQSPSSAETIPSPERQRRALEHSPSATHAGAVNRPGVPMPDAVRRPNLCPDFVAELSEALGLRFIPEDTGDLKRTVGPHDVLDYIYAVLHSPSYRTRYAEFLKTEFPRIPFPEDRSAFRRSVRVGRELRLLHTLRHASLDHPTARFPVTGSNLVAPGHPRYLAPGEPDPHDPKHRPLKKGRVYINKPDRKRGTPAQHFDGIAPDVWDYRLCGYQPARKYLADRRHRTLIPDEITHYRRVAEVIIQTLQATREQRSS